MIRSIPTLALLAPLSLPLALSGLGALDETEAGFPLHTKESASAPVRDVFGAFEEAFGFVPNLARVMGESPALLTSYYGLQNNLQQLGKLSPAEVNVVQMAIAVENECAYCTAGHTMAGQAFFQTPEEVLTCLRAGEELKDPKLRALHAFALEVKRTGGHLEAGRLQAFLDAGYTRAQALDVVACIAAKVMTNTTNALAATPLDEPLKPLAEGLPFGE